MDSESIEDGFEELLRERTDQFRMHPSDSVWTELSTRLHKPRRWPYALGGVLLFGLGIGAGILLERASDHGPASGASILAQHPAQQRLSAAPTQPDPKNAPADPIREQSRIIENFLLNGDLSKVHTLRPTTLMATRYGADRADVTPFVRTTGVMPENAPNTIEYIEAAGLQAGRPRTMAMAKRPGSLIRTDKEKALKPSSRTSVTANVLNTIGRIGKRTGWQLHIAPSFSYRRLVGQASKSSFAYSGFPYSANYGFPTDVNDAVVHKPAFGLEIGSSLTQNIGRKLRLKAGIQFNYNNYDIEAYSYMPEMAPFSAARTLGYGSINTVAYYRNANGFDRTWLRNSHLMVSMPVGLEASLFGNRRVRFNVASTIQPTYVLNNKSYLISTNLKNYAQEPALYRNWNLNAGAEAYLSVDAGTYRWVMGPQVRYQLLSSYKEDYPIREHLVDYGFKIGIQKTLR
jgi:hypothetical protein